MQALRTGQDSAVSENCTVGLAWLILILTEKNKLKTSGHKGGPEEGLVPIPPGIDGDAPFRLVVTLRSGQGYIAFRQAIASQNGRCFATILRAFFLAVDPPHRGDTHVTVKGGGTGIQNSPQMGAIMSSLPLIPLVSCSVGEVERAVHLCPQWANHLQLKMLTPNRMTRAWWQKLETGSRKGLRRGKMVKVRVMFIFPPL